MPTNNNSRGTFPKVQKYFNSSDAIVDTYFNNEMSLPRFGAKFLWPDILLLNQRHVNEKYFRDTFFSSSLLCQVHVFMG